MLSQEQTITWDGLFGAGLEKGLGSEKRTGKWNCRLDETIIGDYLIIPLISVKMLKSESYWMQNCSRDYAGQCIDRRYSIFSIRSRSGERMATLGLENNQGHWHFNQCFGPANIDVLEETFEYLDEDDVLQTESFPTEIYYVAHEVVRLMNAENCSH